MEFDNDRIIRGVHPLEIICWTGLGLAAPVLNGLAVFPAQAIGWLPLLVTAAVLLPVYIAYAKWVVPRLLFRKQYARYAFVAGVFFIVIHLLIYLLYKAAYSFMGGSGQEYFLYSWRTFIRETAWVIMNGGLATGMAFLTSKLDEKETLKALQKESTYYKLRYFRTQLNPHFLFNTLNSIYSLSLSKAEKTPEVIIRLADIMRFLIYECNEEKIPIEKEISFIKNYIEIERIRYDADIRFTLEGDPEGIVIEPFLFISFIENGFKHAIDNSYAKPFIYITLKITSSRITLNVINNTSLELEAQAKKIQGKGLETSKSVLELLYPEAYALDIIQTEKGERKESKLRLKNAQERLEKLYPDSHTLDVILANNTFTVSLILTTGSSDKMYHYRR